MRPGVELAADVMEQSGGEMHVVDHDRRRSSGEEGCGVAVGAVGFTRERERNVPMSRKGEVRKMGFSGGSWSSQYEGGGGFASDFDRGETIAFDQNDIFL
jgi:hypothetical protein